MGGVEDVLGHSVMFIPEAVGEGAKAGIAVLAAGDVAVLENTRFYPGEEKNDPAFADALAEIGDLYVNDAFSARSEEHTSELQSLMRISYAVFCLKKKQTTPLKTHSSILITHNLLCYALAKSSIIVPHPSY